MGVLYSVGIFTYHFIENSWERMRIGNALLARRASFFCRFLCQTGMITKSSSIPPTKPCSSSQALEGSFSQSWLGQLCLALLFQSPVSMERYMPPSSQGASLLAASFHSLHWSMRSQPYLIFMLGNRTHHPQWHTGLTVTIPGGNISGDKGPPLQHTGSVKGSLQETFWKTVS